VVYTQETSNERLHHAAPLLARGRLVSVDGHPVCASCGAAVIPVAAPAGAWAHLPEGQPYPRRSRWFARVTWAELRGMRSHADFIERYPWTTRPELCGGAITTKEDWQEGMLRLRDYHGQLSAARRKRTLRPGDNPYLDLVQVLGGARGGNGAASWAVPGGLAHVLDLPSRRRELAAIFSWAIPSQAAVSLLARYGPLLECGAGTGYWAALLREAAADVLACDLRPPSPGTGPGDYLPSGSPDSEDNPYHFGHRPWTEVLAMDAVDATRAHPGRVLFLCWPPFAQDRASYTALRAYQEPVLLYIGDGPGGPTGTVRFHQELALNWTPAEQMSLPNWPGLRDRVVVYRRNPVRQALGERDRCLECGRYLPTGQAGRCDRCFTRRPPAMALAVNGHRVEYPPDVVEAMPEGLRRAFERSPSLLWPPRPGSYSAVIDTASGLAGALLSRRR
jgi:hypothetical protein